MQLWVVMVGPSFGAGLLSVHPARADGDAQRDGLVIRVVPEGGAQGSNSGALGSPGQPPEAGDGAWDGGRGPSLAAEKGSLPGPAASGRHEPPPGVTLQVPPESGLAPTLYVGGRPWRRVNLFFGSVPLSDLMALRDALRLFPASLLADWRLRTPSGSAAMFGGGRDFYPSLVFVPCDPVACTGHDEAQGDSPSRVVVTLDSDQAASVGFGQAFVSPPDPSAGATSRPSLHPAWTYFGLDVVSDPGRKMVTDQGNTILDTSDDVVRELRNADWRRVAAAHASSWVWPLALSKGQLAMVLSELEQGLTSGLDGDGGLPRSNTRFGAIEARAERLIPEDGGLIIGSLRGAWSESLDRDVNLLWRHARATRRGYLGSAGLEFLNPYRRVMGLRQVRLGMDIERVGYSRTVRSPESGGSAQLQLAEDALEGRSAYRGGVSVGLVQRQDWDLEVGLAALLLEASTRLSARCPEVLKDTSRCPRGGREVSSSPPSAGASVVASWRAWQWSVFAESVGRSPDLMERWGGAFGALPQPALQGESRTAWGAHAALAFASLRYERALERDAITLERGRDGFYRFVNDSPVFIEQWTTRLMTPYRGNRETTLWQGYIEHRHVWARRRGEDSRSIQGWPRQSAEAFGSTPALPLMKMGLGALSCRVFSRVEWRDAVNLDRENLLAERPLWAMEPGVSFELRRPQSRFFITAGTRLAGRLGRSGATPGPAAPPTEAADLSGWGLPPDGPSLLVRLRGDL